MSSLSSAKGLCGASRGSFGSANIRLILMGGAVVVAFIAWMVLAPETRDARSASSSPNQVAGSRQISIAVEPRQSVAGELLSPAPAVSVLDDRNQPVAGVMVTVSLNGEALMQGSTAEATTDDKGRATFDNLRIAQAGAYRLAFSAPGFDTATSAEFVVRFGPPRRMDFVHEPGSGLKGKPISGPPAVRVTDAAGNPVPGINVEVMAIAGTDETPVLSTIMTDNDGSAVFGYLMVPGVGGECRLKFDARAAGVNDLISTPFVLTNRI